jgi:dihydroorotate dehydrogenase electron transfer subunit
MAAGPSQASPSPASPAAAALYQCPVVESRAVGDYRLISFVAREIASAAAPGQFLMIRRSGPSLDPLLPRPLGVHDVDSDLISILIEPVGKGTANLARSRVGDKLEVLGPLGNGFSLEAEGAALLVGGGIGAAPLKLLARALTARGRPVRCLLGFKTRSQAVSAELFRDFDSEVYTEDGSLGEMGLVSEPLPGCLAPPAEGQPQTEVFACGPGAMLKAVARVSRECGAPAQVSVATHMACGIGACQGCVVEAAGGYVKACRQGPVFQAGDLKW